MDILGNLVYFLRLLYRAVVETSSQGTHRVPKVSPQSPQVSPGPPKARQRDVASRASPLNTLYESQEIIHILCLGSMAAKIFRLVMGASHPGACMGIVHEWPQHTLLQDPCPSPCSARIGKNRGPGHETMPLATTHRRPTAQAWT